MSKPKTIKQQIDELNNLLAWFEGDEFDLDQAIEKYQLAKEIVAEISQQIESLKNDLIQV